MKSLILWVVIATCLVLPASFTEARYYDPQTGRFLQEDPEQPGQVRVQGGRVVVIRPSAPSMMSQRLNPYVYVSNNPINLVDPYGLLERGTKEWDDARAKAEGRLRGEVKKAQRKNLVCPSIPGQTEEESIQTTAEAFADEVRPEEWGAGGLGLLLNKQNRENVDKRLREKHPGWPWAQWDEVREELK